jgi:DUF1365 family protein
MSTATRAAPALIRGVVSHHRLHPAEHELSYPALCLRLPLSRLGELPALGLPVDRFGWMTFDARDHGRRDGSSPEAWIREILREHRVEAGGEIELVCFPRMLGYAFKPVSFWLCHDRAGAVVAVLAEVHNTFGERHNYLLAHDDRTPLRSGETLAAEKAFHVSPFLKVEGGYRFRFHFGPQRWLARIDYVDTDGATVLSTSLSGEAQPLTRAALRRARWQFPFQAFGTIARIHGHALRLWWKSVPFHAKPAPPLKETTQ